MKQKRNTLLLISVLLIISIAGLLIQHFFLQKPGATAVVIQNGVTIKELPLNKEAQFTIEDGLGGSNTLVIKDNAIYMSEANCPDLVCVYTGTISQTGEAIACLPHALIITIRDPESDLDSSAW